MVLVLPGTCRRPCEPFPGQSRPVSQPPPAAGGGSPLELCPLAAPESINTSVSIIMVRLELCPLAAPESINASVSIIMVRLEFCPLAEPESINTSVSIIMEELVEIWLRYYNYGNAIIILCQYSYNYGKNNIIMAKPL